MSVEIEVRPLIVTDVFTIARMLSKVSRGAREEIALALAIEDEDEEGKGWSEDREVGGESEVKEKKKLNPTVLGMALFQSLFVEAEEDLKAWLASLISKTKSEFEAMPAGVVIDILDKLLKQEDITDFFSRVSQLGSKEKSPE